MYLFSIALILFITEITSFISLIWFWQKFICFSLPYFYILHWAWCFWSHGGYFTVRILPSYEFTGTFIFVLFIFFACLFLGRTKNITLILCLVGLPLFLTSSNFALFFFFLRHDIYAIISQLSEERGQISLCDFCIPSLYNNAWQIILFSVNVGLWKAPWNHCPVWYIAHICGDRLKVHIKWTHGCT